MPSPYGKRFTIIVASIAVLVLGVATWQAWPRIQFWWRFESLGTNVQGLPEYRHRRTGIVMVRVPGGTFWMGAQKDDPEGQNFDPHTEPDEGPVHEVTVSPFLLGKFEVTQAEWHAVMGDYPSYFDGSKDVAGSPVDSPVDRDRLPVECVSWDDCQEFCRKTGLRLPTEAQWEHACRGGTKTVFSFGSGEGCADWECVPCPERDVHMWYCGNAEGRTHQVGTKGANPFGLHDIHGNVSELCEDLYDEHSYQRAVAPEGVPAARPGSDWRVIRGGYYRDFCCSCRSAYRGKSLPSGRYPDLGLRLAAPCP